MTGSPNNATLLIQALPTLFPNAEHMRFFSFHMIYATVVAALTEPTNDNDLNQVVYFCPRKSSWFESGKCSCFMM